MKIDRQNFEKSFHFSPSIEKDGKISFVLRKNYSDGNEFLSFKLHEPPEGLSDILINPEKNKEILEPLKDIIFNMYIKLYE